MKRHYVSLGVQLHGVNDTLESVVARVKRVLIEEFDLNSESDAIVEVTEYTGEPE